jgi:hypothetical protein
MTRVRIRRFAAGRRDRFVLLVIFLIIFFDTSKNRLAQSFIARPTNHPTNQPCLPILEEVETMAMGELPILEKVETMAMGEPWSFATPMRDEVLRQGHHRRGNDDLVGHHQKADQKENRNGKIQTTSVKSAMRSMKTITRSVSEPSIFWNDVLSHKATVSWISRCSNCVDLFFNPSFQLSLTLTDLSVSFSLFLPCEILARFKYSTAELRNASCVRNQNCCIISMVILCIIIAIVVSLVYKKISDNLDDNADTIPTDPPTMAPSLSFAPTLSLTPTQF